MKYTCVSDDLLDARCNLVDRLLIKAADGGKASHLSLSLRKKGQTPAFCLIAENV